MLTCGRNRAARVAVAVLRVVAIVLAVPVSVLAQEAADAPVIGTATLPRDLSP